MDVDGRGGFILKDTNPEFALTDCRKSQPFRRNAGLPDREQNASVLGFW
jgi:hypothetical protein